MSFSTGLFEGGLSLFSFPVLFGFSFTHFNLPLFLFGAWGRVFSCTDSLRVIQPVAESYRLKVSGSVFIFRHHMLVSFTSIVLGSEEASGLFCCQLISFFSF